MSKSVAREVMHLVERLESASKVDRATIEALLRKPLLSVSSEDDGYQRSQLDFQDHEAIERLVVIEPPAGTKPDLRAVRLELRPTADVKLRDFEPGTLGGISQVLLEKGPRGAVSYSRERHAGVTHFEFDGADDRLLSVTVATVSANKAALAGPRV